MLDKGCTEIVQWDVLATGGRGMYRLEYFDRVYRPKLDCCICYRANVPAHLLLLHSSCRYVMSSVVPPYLLLHALASSSFYPDHYNLMRSFHTASQNCVIIVPLDLAVRIAIGPTKGGGTTGFTRMYRAHVRPPTNTSGGRPHVLASMVETARLEKQPLAIGAVLQQLWQYGGNSGEARLRVLRNSSRYAQYLPALRPLVRSVGSSIIMEGCATFGRVDFLTAAITQFAHFHSSGLHG